MALLWGTTVLCLAMWTTGHLRSHGGVYRWTLSLPSGPVLLAAAATTFVIGVLVLRSRQNLAMGTALAASLLALGLLVAHGPWSEPPAAVHRSPDHTHALRVETEEGLSDRFQLRVEEDGLVTGRSWLVGCVTARPGAPLPVTWTSDRTVRIDTHDGPQLVTVGPDGPSQSMTSCQ